MGVELHPTFNPVLHGVVYQAEGKALIDDLEALEEIAATRDLTPLSAFMDSREPPDDFEPDEDFDGDPDTYVDQACGPWTDWFAASAGVTAIRALLAALRDEENQEMLSDAETVIFDLEQMLPCLEEAARRNAKFRLEVR